jgi:F0F1-type ATP synthase assembly protein I
MAVALGMVVPGLVGYYVDTKLGTRALLTILGFMLGVTYGIWELVRMGRRRSRDHDDVDH